MCQPSYVAVAEYIFALHVSFIYDVLCDIHIVLFLINLVTLQLELRPPFVYILMIYNFLCNVSSASLGSYTEDIFPINFHTNILTYFFQT